MLICVTRRPEVNIGILCANVPLVRPIYLHYTGRLRNSKAKPSAGTSGQRMWPSKSGPSTKSLDPAGAAREKPFPRRPLNTYNTTSTDDTVLPMQRFSDRGGMKAEWPQEPDRIYPGFGSEGTLHSGKTDERWVEEQV